MTLLFTIIGILFLTAISVVVLLNIAMKQELEDMQKFFRGGHPTGYEKKEN